MFFFPIESDGELIEHIHDFANLKKKRVPPTQTQRRRRKRRAKNILAIFYWPYYRNADFGHRSFQNLLNLHLLLSSVVFHSFIAIVRHLQMWYFLFRKEFPEVRFDILRKKAKSSSLRT